MSEAIRSGVREAGPNVQTIFVRRIIFALVSGSESIGSIVYFIVLLQHVEVWRRKILHSARQRHNQDNVPRTHLRLQDRT